MKLKGCFDFTVPMMRSLFHFFLTTAVLFSASPSMAEDDPLLNSWFTKLSGRYASIYENTTKEANGETTKIWAHGGGSQLQPAYAGVHEVVYTATDVYVRSSGLPFHTMGPWYLNEGKTNFFPNWPQHTGKIFRFARVPSAGSNTATHLGDIGMFVDGVSMYNSLDAFSYNNAEGADAGAGTDYTGDGVWFRDAFVNEGVTFDSAFAHQGNGTHHYHANPPGLRALLGDSVVHNPDNTYTETPNGRHSPILGWVRDGYPLYGPYGYDDPNDSASTVRRMISGYQPRNMVNGDARTTLPQWTNTLHSRTLAVAAEFHGPAVSDDFPVGKYVEDYDYRGDLGETLGTDFDLDIYNGRFCVTPEFPGGTYAYFVAIAADGTPVYPYNIGGSFKGATSGSTENTIPTVDGTSTIRYFQFDPEKDPTVSSVSVDGSSGDVTLVWNAAEGGSYKVETSPDESTWTELPVRVEAGSNTLTMIDGQRANIDDKLHYRARLDTLREFDSTGLPAPVASSPGRQTVITVTLSGGTSDPPSNLSILPTGATFDGNAVAILGRPSQFEIRIAVPTDSLAATTYNVTATFADAGTLSGGYTHVIHNNVLLMIVDDWGTDHAPYYNTHNPPNGIHIATMTNLDDLVAGGVRFTNAYANPSCSPTRATILTGRQAFRTSVGSPPGTGFSVEVDEVTMPEVLISNGAPHELATFGKWHLSGGNEGYADRGGWPYFVGSNDNIDDYEAWPKNRNGLVGTSAEYATSELVDEAKVFIDAQESVGKPWVVWMGFHAPHSPFHNPPAALHQGTGAPSGDKRFYIRMLEALDTEIGRLLESVDQSRTNIIIIGDNGSPGQVIQPPFGDAASNGVNPPSGRAKGSLYEGGTHVPLVIKGPAVTTAASTSDALVNSADLYSTVIEMAGYSVPANAGHDSYSLMPILQDATDPADRYASSEIFDETTADVNDGRSIRLSSNPAYKLIAKGNPNDRFDDPSYEFYNISVDPNEATNLTPNGTGANALDDARGDLSEPALTAFNNCIAKHQALGGGFSDASAGVPQILYLQLDPGETGAFGVPGNPNVDPDVITVNGEAAEYLGRFDQTDTYMQFWVKVRVVQAPSYDNILVDFPTNPNNPSAVRDFVPIQIVEAP